MSGGQVVEVGSHQQLMAARRVYYDMWEAQAAADEEFEQIQPPSMPVLPLCT